MIDKDRWVRLDALLDSALDQPAEERRRFLRSECGGDETLCREALRLLDLAETGEESLEPRALAARVWNARLGTENEPLAELPPGTQVGPYRVIGLLGRGGMGYVYEAFDPKLARHVALKVLPPELETEERRRRFEREARTLAAINHPGIVHVYSIEEAGGARFIAMERVPGRTLAEQIVGGGLPLSRVIEIAIRLADALVAAHARGIVHRDLKPANVMVGEEGQVKVLDFGVAKWKRGLGAADPGEATRDGFLVGTASYMAPEQAQGAEVDHRTDLFSLGVMIFEMSTGELPFRGGSTASVISAILRDTPPSVTDIRPGLPRDLSRLVRRCLAKDPDHRYGSAAEVRQELEALQQRLFARGKQAGKRWRPYVTGAALAAAVFAVALLSLRRHPPSDAIEGSFARITSAPGPEFFPTLSPNGALLAYAGRQSGRWDVFLQRIEGRRAIDLTAESHSDDVQPAFSPDGRSIAFRSSREGGGIFVMGATGESPRRVADRGWNPSWSPDGREIAFATQPVFDSPYDRPTASEIWAVDPKTGGTRLLVSGDGVQPAWSPHGQRIAFWGLLRGGSRRDLWTVPSQGGPALPVTEDDAVDWSPTWGPDGRHLYFSSDRGGSMNLWRIAIDEASGRVLGRPERVTTPAAFAHHPSFARDGSCLAYVSTAVEHQLQRVRFDPVAERVTGEPEPLVRETRRLAFPNFSPDGEWIVYSETEPQEDLVLSRADGTGRRLLTNDVYRDRRPRFSPDGTEIAFYSDRGGHYEVWALARDGSGLRPLTRDVEHRNARYPVWSPDGSSLLLSRPGVTGVIVSTDADLGAPPLAELPALAAGADFVPLDWSPDGQRIAGMRRSRDGERAGIAVYDLKRRIYERLVDFGTWPQWLRDGRRLVFQGPSADSRDSDPSYPRGESAFIVDRVTGRVRQVLTIPEVTVGYPTLSPDATWLLFVHTSVKADIWTLTTVASTAAPAGS